MRHHQKSHPDETEQRTEIPPGIGKPIVAVQKILIDLDKMTYRKQERSVIDRSIHGWSRKSYTRQGRSQRSDHRHDTDNDTDRRKKGEQKDGQRLRCDHKQDRSQVQWPEPTGEWDIHRTEHHIISEDTHQGKDNRVRQQFPEKGGNHIHISRCQPLVAGTELQFATDGIHRSQQDDHLEEDKEKRIAQVNGVIEIGIVQRMVLCLNRK